MIFSSKFWILILTEKKSSIQKKSDVYFKNYGISSGEPYKMLHKVSKPSKNIEYFLKFIFKNLFFGFIKLKKKDNKIISRYFKNFNQKGCLLITRFSLERYIFLSQKKLFFYFFLPVKYLENRLHSRQKNSIFFSVFLPNYRELLVLSLENLSQTGLK